MTDEQYEAQVIHAYLKEEQACRDWERAEVPHSLYRPDEHDLFRDLKHERYWLESEREFEES